MIQRPVFKKLHKALLITLIAFVINVIGFVFFILKFVSFPFVPNRNIDNMSDYYTTVWERVQGNTIDEGRFQIVDLTENNREEILEILSAISEMNPKVIGLDINYIYRDNKTVDSLYVEFLNSSPNIILPVEYSDKQFLYNVFYDEINHKEYGVVSFPGTRDVLRTFYPIFTSGEKSHKSFACAIAEMCGADMKRVYRKKKHLINYTTLTLTDADAIPGSQFININERDSQSLASQISNRIVLLGTTRLTNDCHMTPMGYDMSGVMIHAHIINSLIEGKIIRTVHPLFMYMLCFLIAFLLMMFEQGDKSKDIVKIGWKNKIIRTVLMFLCSVIVFSIIGTLLYCKCNLFIDFAPYIVVWAVWYLMKDKEFNIKFSR